MQGKAHSRFSREFIMPNLLLPLYKTLICFILFSSIAFSEPNKAWVEIAVAKQGHLKQEQDFIGTDYFNQSSVLASQTKGFVLNVNFDMTQTVKKGDVPVELDHEILDAKIKAIKASL